MIVMPRFVFAILLTVRTLDDITGIERALAFGQVTKEVDSRSAMATGDDDVPRPILGVCGHAGTTFCRGGPF